MSETLLGESAGNTSYLLSEHREALYNWEKLAEAAQKITNAREALDHVNSGLNTETHRFTSNAGNTKINVFRRDELGYKVDRRSSINLVGGHTRIIGDHLEEIDGQLVLFDTDIGYGFSISGVKIEPIQDITNHDTFRIYSSFLRMVNDSPVGVHTDIDCM